MSTRKKSSGRALVPVHTDTPTHLIGVDRIVPLQVYHVREVHPSSPGPWSGEADKIAWIDPATGLPCIIRRHARLGYLSGYVAVRPGHPLFGFSHDAVPHSIGIRVHGGLSYGEPCNEDEPEARSVCHVHPARPRTRHQAPVRQQPAAPPVEHGEDLWWFGFDCNQSFDLVPNKRTPDFLDAENAPVYRDESYLYLECQSLAAQLDAIGRGDPIVDHGVATPPLGMAPFRSGDGL